MDTALWILVGLVKIAFFILVIKYVFVPIIEWLGGDEE